ncbi:MAG: PEGA domain-containing protein, partial [Methanoregula sp.]|nr:PEGA domain-containing protein [Methanoregula sp.]
LACFLLTGTVSAGIQAYMGETVPLSGYSPTSNSVYLFLTGPNLPVNGVALSDITRRADEGGFTVVSVDGTDDRWSYNWHTGSVNGRLDAGTYTIWVVNGPNDRSNLQNAEYGTISVTLGSPSVAVTTPAQPGSLAVSSVPADASVVVNGNYMGKTPLTMDNLVPGANNVTVSKFGFTPFTTTVDIRSGERAEITAALPAERGTLIVNTTPSGANISVDGKEAGITPVTLTNLLPGNHTVTLTKDGYVPADQQVAITAGTTYPLTIALSPSSPLSSLPMRTPGLTAGTLLALCAALIACAGVRSRFR